jgi:hypothetical protein
MSQGLRYLLSFVPHRTAHLYCFVKFTAILMLRHFELKEWTGKKNIYCSDHIAPPFVKKDWEKTMKISPDNRCPPLFGLQSDAFCVPSYISWCCIKSIRFKTRMFHVYVAAHPIFQQHVYSRGLLNSSAICDMWVIWSGIVYTGLTGTPVINLGQPPQHCF